MLAGDTLKNAKLTDAVTCRLTAAYPNCRSYPILPCI